MAEKIKIVLRLGRNWTIFDNLVRFALVTPRFYAKEVVWPESTTLISLMFAMGLGY